MSSFSEQESVFTPRKVLIGLGVLGLAILLLVGAPTALRNANEALDNSPFSRKATPARVIAEIENDPQLRGMVTAFRTHYPEEFQAFAERIAAALNQGGESAASREAFTYMERFMQSKLRFMTNAPSPDLQRLAGGIAELYEALRGADVRYCAHFFEDGPSPGEQMPRAAQPASMRLNALQFRAARHGEDRKGAARGPLSAEDEAAWLARARRIDPAAGALLGSERLLHAPPAQQCDAAVAMFRGIADLPVEQSANVLATVLTQAAAPPR